MEPQNLRAHGMLRSPDLHVQDAVLALCASAQREPNYLWFAGNEGMEKKKKLLMGYIGFRV